MSSVSSARGLLAGFAAGHVPAAEVAAAAAAAYYAAPEAAPTPLREIVGLIEREAPGMVELAARAGGAGFEVRPVARPLPATVERELRRRAPELLAGSWGEAAPAAIPPFGGERWWMRFVRAVRRVFSGAS